MHRHVQHQPTKIEHDLTTKDQNRHGDQSAQDTPLYVPAEPYDKNW
jgi:hypothetical protein